MQDKCVICGILFGVPCPNPVCSGHHNESVGDMCAYCAGDEREDVLVLRNFAPSLLSSLEDFDPDFDSI
jgi:hypothetical protein